MANDFGRLEKFPYGNWETIYDRNIFVFCKKYFFPIKNRSKLGTNDFTTILKHFRSNIPPAYIDLFDNCEYNCVSKNL